MITPDQKNYIESEEFVDGFRCLELEVPWMVAESIYGLDEIINKKDVVLEIGSGGSTLFFAQRCAGVSVIETNHDWGNKVVESVRENGLSNVVYNTVNEEENIIKLLETSDTDGVTVFSVDPQGGYNRSKILNAFINKGISTKLRVVILDNYAHEGEFPLHHDTLLNLGEWWKVFTYIHPRWAGKGTRIYLKIK